MKRSIQIVAAIIALSCSLSSFAKAFTSAHPPSRHTATALFSEAQDPSSRRTFISNTIAATATTILLPLLSTQPAIANDNNNAALLSDLTTSLDKISTIPSLLQQSEWDKVRTILKTPPVNSLWNLGDSTNPLVKLAKSTGDMDLMELKDELSISLQMTDQYSYDNVFIYYQPGNGKVKVKEPLEMANKAIGELREAIDVLSK
jgi:hypothetical protein